MTRYAQDADGRPVCPLCLSYGEVTLTAAPTPETDEPIDDGCTEPLHGSLCVECGRLRAALAALEALEKP